MHGVCLFVNLGIHVTEVCMSDNPLSEHIWLSIKLHGEESLLIGGIYRSPAADTNWHYPVCNYNCIWTFAYVPLQVLMNNFLYENVNKNISKHGHFHDELWLTNILYTDNIGYEILEQEDCPIRTFYFANLRCYEPYKIGALSCTSNCIRTPASEKFAIRTFPLRTFTCELKPLPAF